MRFQHCDVTRETDIAGAMDAAAAAFGGLDIVFNNAGAAGARLPIEEMTGEAWDATQALLLRSVALGIRYAVPHLRARGGGSIINTASIAGLQAGWSPIAYGVAKAGVIQLTPSRRRNSRVTRCGQRDLPRLYPHEHLQRRHRQSTGGSRPHRCGDTRGVAGHAASADGRLAAAHSRCLRVPGERRGGVRQRHAPGGRWRPDHRPAPCVGPGDKIADTHSDFRCGAGMIAGPANNLVLKQGLIDMLQAA